MLYVMDVIDNGFDLVEMDTDEDSDKQREEERRRKKAKKSGMCL